MKIANSLVQKYHTFKKQYQEKNVLQVCRAFLRILLSMVTAAYFLVMAVGLPFYFDTETDYSFIGTNKADFFRECGFFLGRMLLHILLFYAVAAFVCYFWEHRKEKGRLSGLINKILDSLSLTDKFAIAYGLALFLSYYYSKYPDMAVLGAHGWYMGFWPQVMLLGSYFAISRLFADKNQVWTVGAACLLLGVSFAVFLLGILNRYGINPLGMEYAGPGFISTIGNINWYCGYWSVCFPLGAGWFVFLEPKAGESSKKYFAKKGLLLFYTASGFAAGITQGSDSCILTLTAMLLLTGSLAVKNRQRWKRFLEMLFTFCLVTGVLSLVQKWFPERNQYPTGFYNFVTTPSFFIIGGILVFGSYLLGKRVQKVWFAGVGVIIVTIVSFAALVVINTTHPGSIGALSDNPWFTFSPAWGNARGTTWSAGVRTWTTQDALHKMIGVGPDCMAAHIYDGPDEELLAQVKAQFGNSRLTNAHSEWISLLANLGLFGLVGFAGMIISGIVRFVEGFGGCTAGDRTAQAGYAAANRTAQAGDAEVRRALCMACGTALLCYTANNIVSFQQIMNISQMFLILGLGEALKRSGSAAG